MTLRYVLIDDEDDGTTDVDLEVGPVYSPAAITPTGTGGTSLLSSYLAMLGQSVTWKSKTGNDGDDDTFTSSSINVLWAHGARVIRTVTGDELQCQAICKCEAAVEAGDVITKDSRDYPVLGLVGVAYDGSMRSLAMGGSRSGGA